MPLLASDRPTSARWVVVDDTSPRISYTMEDMWSAQKISPTQNQGPSGRPYNDTLHILAPLIGGSNRGLSGISFNFSGVAIAVYITNNLPNVTGANAVDCWVDGIQSEVNIKPIPGGTPINNYMVCDASNLVDRSHEVSVVPNGSLDSFLFDRIQYRPSNNASLENEVVYVNSFDESMTFGRGWQGTEGAWYSYTSMRGSTFEFEFTAQEPTSPSNFTYAIDGGSPQFVHLPGHSVGFAVLEDQKLFEIPSLSMGQHNLSVVHNGDNTTMPLTLDYLFIQNGSFPNASSPPKTDSGTRNRLSRVGPIVGCAVAAVVCVLLLILSYFYYRRQGQVSKERVDHPEEHCATHVNPFPTRTIIQPFDNHAHHLARCQEKTTRVLSDNLSPLALPYLMDPSLAAMDAAIRHEDNGVRMREQMVELPPQYTMS
ncbi:hypothetical protein CPB83DRAFT_830477 [Crepidotus variabilis]|uniref:Transmembrane protein n=1 Tax=Crepidotus variabilis TaxID=179855 RepID=A0A9P6EUF4_9AGAR|nr:hypothetical protein CPB83DRAFT_830477 [Crepidotus variabilis]